MKKQLLPGLALCALLSACPGNDTHTGDGSPSPDASPTSVTSTASPGPDRSPASAKPSAVPVAGVKRGIFILGEGLQVFKACGSQEELWLEDTPAKDLTNQYKALHLMDLEPVYVELSGEIKPTGKAKGFEASYKKTLKVKKLSSLKPWVSNGSCFATDFIAQGSPPEWSMQVLKGGDVFFKSNEGEFPAVDTLAYSPPKQESNHWRYEFHFRTPDQETLKADFAEESCSTKGANFDYSVKILFRGITYTGCAKKLF